MCIKLALAGHRALAAYINSFQSIELTGIGYPHSHTHLSKNRVTDFPIAEFQNNFQANNHMLVLSAAYLLNFEKLRRQISK